MALKFSRVQFSGKAGVISARLSENLFPIGDESNESNNATLSHSYGGQVVVNVYQLLFSFFGSVVDRPLTAADLVFNTQEFKPFSYTEHGDLRGRVKGPIAELVRAICNRAKLECRIHSRPWRRAVLEVKKGAALGLVPIGWNRPRARWLQFSPQLVMTEYGFFINAEEKTRIKQLSDLNGARVAVFGPSNTAYSLAKLKETSLPDITIDMAPDDPEGFKKLKVHRVTAVYSNREVGKAIIRALGIKGLSYALPHRKLHYYVGLSRAFTPPQIWQRFNTAVMALKQEGEVSRLLYQHRMVIVE